MENGCEVAVVLGSPWGECGCSQDSGPHVLSDGAGAVRACLARGLAEPGSGRGDYIAAHRGPGAQNQKQTYLPNKAQ